MRSFIILAAVFLAACATAAPVIVSAEQPQPLMVEADFPVVCTRQETFDEITGQRTNRVIFTDNMRDIEVMVHVDDFAVSHDQQVTVVYQTFPSRPGIVCILHTSEPRRLYLTSDTTL